ncbi:hypothetical protein ACOXXX_03050 [Thalassococcus sp. BH17M4-6]|uniref:hypothetical protein n=1 Tax=Thalassococcus sp. BH17M4-6 TaxID=3413148 RepID=UPI003BCB6C22
MTPRPDLLLHLGQDKTGSTAIQRSLYGSPAALRDAGLYFPDPGGHASHRQIFPHLTGCLPEDPVQMKTLAKSEAAAFATAQAMWADTLRQMQAAPPRRLILSSETEFRSYPKAGFERLVQTLNAVVDKVRVVAYLRSPASFFVSRVQQDLKKRPEPSRIPPDHYRRVLAPWRDLGPGPVEVVEYRREALFQGDVIADFCQRFLPELDRARLADPGYSNPTLSAEAMDLLQDFHRGEVQAPYAWYARRPQRFKNLVAQADAEVEGKTRPRLHDSLRAVIEARTTDLDWLEGEFGLTFGDVSPPQMPRATAEERFQTLRDVADICPVDSARKAALWQRVQAIARRDRSLLARAARGFRR